MIFVTVGSQVPFERLVRAIDEWAESRGRSDVFAQIATSTYQPAHVRFTDFLAPVEFEQRLQSANVIVAHAGIGSIISALEVGKPIVVMPRRAHLRETRNDHQVAAANWFRAHARVIVANDESELAEKMDEGLTLPDMKAIGKGASPRLIATIRSFLEERSRQTDLA